MPLRPPVALAIVTPYPGVYALGTLCNLQRVLRPNAIIKPGDCTGAVLPSRCHLGQPSLGSFPYEQLLGEALEHVVGPVECR